LDQASPTPTAPHTNRTQVIVGILAALAIVGAAIIAYFAAIRPVQIAAEYTQTAEARATTNWARPTATDPAVTSEEIPTSYPTPNVQARILTPPDDTVVPSRIGVEGTISSFEEPFHAFLCVAPSPGNPIFPQGEILPINGKWTVHATFQTSGAQYQAFVVFTVSEEAQKRLADPHVGISGMDSLPDGAFVISPIITVIRD